MGEKGGFWGKFPKTIEFTFKFYRSAFSSNSMILKFCTVSLYGSEKCVRKSCAILSNFARITGEKVFLGSRSLNNNRIHFIFGIIDVDNDTEQLAKKFLSITARIIAKRGPNAC